MACIRLRHWVTKNIVHSGVCASGRNRLTKECLPGRQHPQRHVLGQQVDPALTLRSRPSRESTPATDATASERLGGAGSASAAGVGSSAIMGAPWDSNARNISGTSANVPAVRSAPVRTRGGRAWRPAWGHVGTGAFGGGTADQIIDHRRQTPEFRQLVRWNQLGRLAISAACGSRSKRSPPLPMRSQAAI